MSNKNNNQKQVLACTISANPFLKDEFIGYLETNGWIYTRDSMGFGFDMLYHPTISLYVYIKGTNIDVRSVNSEAFTTRKQFMIHASFEGLDKLDYHKFIMLMHVLDVCPLTDFTATQERANAKVLGDIAVPQNITSN